jgi:NO-binding membrane sensor protein with MHYT domain
MDEPYNRTAHLRERRKMMTNGIHFFADNESMHIQSSFLTNFDYRLAALSGFTVILATLAALGLRERLMAAQGASWFVWLGGGALAMGMGIWSMHYIGMKAFGLYVENLYDSTTILLSMLASILASAVTLLVVSRRRSGADSSRCKCGQESVN